MSILSEFSDSMEAWKEYKKIHKSNPDKELYILILPKKEQKSLSSFLSELEAA